MIRKINNHNAWVCYAKEAKHLTTPYYLYCYRLPLFDTRPAPIGTTESIDPDEIILLTTFFPFLIFEPPLTEDFIEQVNKRWNEFYD